MGENSRGHFPGEEALIVEGIASEKEERERTCRGKKLKEKVKTCTGRCTRKPFTKTTDGEKVDRYNTTSFLQTVEHRF